MIMLKEWQFMLCGCEFSGTAAALSFSQLPRNNENFGRSRRLNS